jgi:hypothetical protein
MVRGKGEGLARRLADGGDAERSKVIVDESRISTWDQLAK